VQDVVARQLSFDSCSWARDCVLLTQTGVDNKYSPMFKLQYLRLRSRYMLFCFIAVFSFSILFLMFQNSLSRPAIETLVTETHKQINNFKNFKVIEPAVRSPVSVVFQHQRFVFFPGQFESGRAKRIGG